MKKVIIKSIIITFLLILVTLCTLFALFSVINPSSIAKASFTFNNKALCVKYSELAYEKDPTIDNLAELIENCIWAEKDEKITKYGEIFLNDSEFEEYSKKRDSLYPSWIASNVAISFYHLDKIPFAINYAINFTTDFSNTALSPIKYLVVEVKNNNDDNTLNLIIERLNSLDDDNAKELAKIIK